MIKKKKKKKKSLHTDYFTRRFIFDVFAVAIWIVSTYQFRLFVLSRVSDASKCCQDLSWTGKEAQAQPDSPGSADCWLLKIPLCRDVLSQRRIHNAGKSDIFTLRFSFFAFSLFPALLVEQLARAGCVIVTLRFLPTSRSVGVNGRNRTQE